MKLRNHYGFLARTWWFGDFDKIKKVLPEK
jgi:hypothetical protein